MTCAIAALARLLVEQRRIDFADAAVRQLVAAAVADGCLPDPHGGSAAYDVFVATIKARAGIRPAPVTAPIPARRPSPAERRVAIEARLRADPTASDRAIAKVTGTSDKTVGALRRVLGLRNPRADKACRVQFD